MSSSEPPPVRDEEVKEAEAEEEDDSDDSDSHDEAGNEEAELDKKRVHKMSKVEVGKLVLYLLNNMHLAKSPKKIFGLLESMGVNKPSFWKYSAFALRFRSIKKDSMKMAVLLGVKTSGFPVC